MFGFSGFWQWAGDLRSISISFTFDKGVVKNVGSLSDPRKRLNFFTKDMDKIRESQGNN